MEHLVEQIKSFKEEVTFSSLRKFIESIDINSLDYGSHLIEPCEPGDYGRNELTMEPFECVLMCWPAGVESAIHLHDGLFGYVWIVEGELDNVFYKEQDGKLIECSIDHYGKNELVPEPDGVIHKLRNNHKSKKAVSIHFYYPALYTFDGMRIFNTETGDIGILSEKANSAYWDEKKGNFKKIERDAFDFVSYDQYCEQK